MRVVSSPSSGGKQPTTPTIGLAVDNGTGTGATVAFTPGAYLGKTNTALSYTATSSPGSVTGSSLTSPITVNGLTTDSPYIFQVRQNTTYGVSSPESAFSNLVTPTIPNSFDSIATISPANGTTSITFSSIPQTYISLQVRSIVRDTSTGGYDAIPVDIRPNNDATTIYAIHSLRATGTTVTADGYTGQPQGLPWGAAVRSGSSNTNTYGVMILDIIDYTSTSKYKTLRMRSGGDVNGANGVISLDSALWQSTSAITSLTIKADSTAFASGTTFALYGIEA
jgi:hypothetical protein